MRLEHHLVGGYVRYISPHIIIIILHISLGPHKGEHLSSTLHLSPIFGQFPSGLHSLNTTTEEYSCPVIAIVKGLQQVC